RRCWITRRVCVSITPAITGTWPATVPVTASSTSARWASSKKAISPLEPSAKIPSTPASSRRVTRRSREGRSSCPSAVSGASRGGITPVRGAGAEVLVIGIGSPSEVNQGPGRRGPTGGPGAGRLVGGGGRDEQAGGAGAHAAGALVARQYEDLADSALLYDLRAVHHGERVGDETHQRADMGDEHPALPELAPEVNQQLQ